jgi:type IV pilus assembly protein PilC
VERTIFDGLLLKVRTGRSLSEALAAFKNSFSHAEVNMIRTAEKVGEPKYAIKHMCEFSKTTSAIKRKILSAMIYPCIVLVVALCVFFILSMVVIPQFQAMFFTQMQRELPLLTRIVVSVCAFLRENILLILFLPFAVFLGLKFFTKSRHNSIKVFKFPIISFFVREYNLYLFTSSLSMLLRCNVQFQESLNIAKDVVFDEIFSKKLAIGIERIKRGELISEALGEILPKFATGLIVAGENIGSLDVSFSEISKFCGDNLVSKLTIVAATVEPLLITFLALVVGVIIIAMFLPMIDMMRDINF